MELCDPLDILDVVARAREGDRDEPEPPALPGRRRRHGRRHGGRAAVRRDRPPREVVHHDLPDALVQAGERRQATLDGPPLVRMGERGAQLRVARDRLERFLRTVAIGVV